MPDIKRPYDLMLLLLMVALPLFGHLDELPIQIWDESRLAVSALEMSQTHNWLVTTYDYQPDMWSTKPPLMIWLQVVFIKMLGPQELAIRLPSALAALASCILLFVFVRRLLGNAIPALIAVLVLLTAQGYVDIHGTRTGDYDALLILFTTAYCCLYFMFLETGRLRYLYITIACIIGAALTKGIAGLMLLPGLLLYTLLVNKLLSVLRRKQLYAGIGLFILIVGGYYLLREQAGPGYLKAVQENELGGRFNTVIEEHAGGPDYYLNLLAGGYFSPWWWLWIAGSVLGLFSVDRLHRRLALWSVVSAVCFLLVISLAQTKLSWYMLPAYPLMAIPVALLALQLWQLALRIPVAGIWSKNALPVLLLLLLVTGPYVSLLKRTTSAPPVAGAELERRHLSYFLREAVRGHRDVNGHTFVTEGYEADLIWYYKVLEQQGKKLSMKPWNAIDSNALVVAWRRQQQDSIRKHNHITIADTSYSVTIYHTHGSKRTTDSTLHRSTGL